MRDKVRNTDSMIELQVGWYKTRTPEGLLVKLMRRGVLMNQIRPIVNLRLGLDRELL